MINRDHSASKRSKTYQNISTRITSYPSLKFQRNLTIGYEWPIVAFATDRTSVGTQHKKRKNMYPTSSQSYSLSYTVTIPVTTRHDSSRFESDGKIVLWEKKKIQHQCLSMLLLCLHDSSTNPLRVMKIPQGGDTNAHDASTLRHCGSTVQAGSTTVAPRPPPHTVMNRDESRQIGVSNTPIHQVGPRSTRNTFTEPLQFFRFRYSRATI